MIVTTLQTTDLGQSSQQAHPSPWGSVCNTEIVQDTRLTLRFCKQSAAGPRVPQDTSGCVASASRTLPQGCRHDAGPQRWQTAEGPCVARLGPVRRGPPGPFSPSPSPPRLPSRHDEAKEKLNPANSHLGRQARRCVGVCMLTPSQRASASMASKKLTMRARSDKYKNHLHLFKGLALSTSNGCPAQRGIRPQT